MGRASNRSITIDDIDLGDDLLMSVRAGREVFETTCELSQLDQRAQTVADLFTLLVFVGMAAVRLRFPAQKHRPRTSEDVDLLVSRVAASPTLDRTYLDEQLIRRLAHLAVFRDGTFDEAPSTQQALYTAAAFSNLAIARSVEHSAVPSSERRRYRVLARTARRLGRLSQPERGNT